LDVDVDANVVVGIVVVVLVVEALPKSSVVDEFWDISFV
jgi:hypothetical protein